MLESVRKRRVAPSVARLLQRVLGALALIWVTLLWLNPPYDDDRHGDEKRLELAFLKSTTPKLVRGGVLALVIPQSFSAWSKSPSFHWTTLSFLLTDHCLLVIQAERVGPHSTVGKYAIKIVRIRNDVGVSRKSVPTKAGTLFILWNVYYIIDPCPRQF